MSSYQQPIIRTSGEVSDKDWTSQPVFNVKAMMLHDEIIDKKEKGKSTRRNGVVQQTGIELPLDDFKIDAESHQTKGRQTKKNTEKAKSLNCPNSEAAGKEYRERRNAVDDFTSEFTKERTTLRVLVKKL